MAVGVARGARTWRVAMVVPLQGPAGLFGPSCEAISELAVRELNDEGGILGREVTLEIVDGGAHPAKVAADVRGLVDDGRVDAVTGWHISSVRHSLAPVLAGRVPYVYTSLYEGGEHRSGIYCSGEVPGVQILPALRWLRDNAGTRSWFVVGDDYVWPHGTSYAVRQYARELDLRLAGAAFIGLRTCSWRAARRRRGTCSCRPPTSALWPRLTRWICSAATCTCTARRRRR